MADYMTLIGADEVRSASRTMARAAETMSSAASTIDSAVRQQQYVLENFTREFTALVERLEQCQSK